MSTSCSSVPALADPPAIEATGTHALVVNGGDTVMLEPPTEEGIYQLTFDPDTGNVTWEKVTGELLPTGTNGVLRRVEGLTSFLATKGILYNDAAGHLQILTYSSDDNGKVLRIVAGVPALSDATIDTDDEGVVFVNESGEIEQIEPGTDGQILKMVGGAPVWSSPSSGIVSTGSVGATLEGVVANTLSSATVNVTAPALKLSSSLGDDITVENANITVDITASGENGLDTGAEQSNQWYYIYAISNGTDVEGLISLSSTAPTLPAGFEYFGLISVFRNNGSGNIVWYFQRGRKFVTENVLWGADFAMTTGWAAISTGTNLNTILPPLVKTVTGIIGGASTATGKKTVAVGSTVGGMGQQIVGSRLTTDADTIDSFKYDVGTFYDVVIADPSAPVIYGKVAPSNSDHRRAVINGYTI